jgi:hypothetical protein
MHLPDRPVRRDPELEYITIWNGVNDGRDGDLMPHPAREEPRGTRPPPEESGTLCDRVVEELRAAPWSSSIAIARALGVTTHRLHSTLYTLRKQGRILARESAAGDLYKAVEA